MAVAELPSRTMVLPHPGGRPSTRSTRVGYAAWIPLAGILIGIASLLYLAQTSEVANTGYSIQDLQVQESNWEMRNEQLSLQLDKARALSEVQAQATSRLHMVPANNPIFLKAAPVAEASPPTASSRGDSRGLPTREKTASSNSDPLAPIRSSLSTLVSSHLQLPKH